ncbi:hypothetical protein M514_09900 [Trichuris suis]|uniref:Uncharacterized protein n=1 Tax=Trichuris suis TaxID=68888 RepID=A0A085N817_9BILA|nr:hypothetical protein M514_09900 [Trichuris suis]
MDSFFFNGGEGVFFCSSISVLSDVGLLSTPDGLLSLVSGVTAAGIAAIGSVSTGFGVGPSATFIGSCEGNSVASLLSPIFADVGLSPDGLSPSVAGVTAAGIAAIGSLSFGSGNGPSAIFCCSCELIRVGIKNNQVREDSLLSSYTFLGDWIASNIALTFNKSDGDVQIFNNKEALIVEKRILCVKAETSPAATILTGIQFKHGPFSYLSVRAEQDGAMLATEKPEFFIRRRFAFWFLKCCDYRRTNIVHSPMNKRRTIVYLPVVAAMTIELSLICVRHLPLSVHDNGVYIVLIGLVPFGLELVVQHDSVLQSNVHYKIASKAVIILSVVRSCLGGRERCSFEGTSGLF